MELTGVFVGAGVREGGERSDYRTREKYTVTDRYVVALADSVGQLPQFRNCESSAVMLSVASAYQFGEYVTLLCKIDNQGKVWVTGFKAQKVV